MRYQLTVAISKNRQVIINELLDAFTEIYMFHEVCNFCLFLNLFTIRIFRYNCLMVGCKIAVSLLAYSAV